VYAHIMPNDHSTIACALYQLSDYSRVPFIPDNFRSIPVDLGALDNSPEPYVEFRLRVAHRQPFKVLARVLVHPWTRKNEAGVRT
jgi:hypothetical protein